LALLQTGARALAAYLDSGNFDVPSTTRLIINNGTTSGLTAWYIDRDDLILAKLSSVEQNGGLSGRVDPNLVNSTGANVGFFGSPLSDQDNFPYMIGDYEPATNSQRIYQWGGLGPVYELDINDPSVQVDSDAFPFSLSGGPDDFAQTTQFSWIPNLFPGASLILFPEDDFGILCGGRVWTPTQFSGVMVGITLSTGAGEPIADLPCRYHSGSNSFNRAPIFGESDIQFIAGQFLPDDDSTHLLPKGELMFWSRALNVGGGVARIYVKWVDWNPYAVAGTPNRVHKRETLFSRFEVTTNTVPSGSPLTPIDGSPAAVPASLVIPSLFFTKFGQRRLNLVSANSTAVGDTIFNQTARAAEPALISIPSQRADVVTNRVVEFRAEVSGDLGEPVSNAEVTVTAARVSTVGEVLPVTPTPGETVAVANVPIDRDIEYPFVVYEDGVALVETTNYSVNEGTGEITFVSPKPLGGNVYTIDYAHTAAPATPSHGTVIDSLVFSDIEGAAIARVRYPDDATLVGQIDQVTMDTPT